MIHYLWENGVLVRAKDQSSFNKHARLDFLTNHYTIYMLEPPQKILPNMTIPVSLWYGSVWQLCGVNMRIVVWQRHAMASHHNKELEAAVEKVLREKLS